MQTDFTWKTALAVRKPCVALSLVCGDASVGEGVFLHASDECCQNLLEKKVANLCCCGCQSNACCDNMI